MEWVLFVFEGMGLKVIPDDYFDVLDIRTSSLNWLGFASLVENWY